MKVNRIKEAAIVNIFFFTVKCHQHHSIVWSTHAQPFYEIGHFWEEKSVGRKIFGQIVIQLLWARKNS